MPLPAREKRPGVPRGDSQARIVRARGQRPTKLVKPSSSTGKIEAVKELKPKEQAPIARSPRSPQRLAKPRLDKPKTPITPKPQPKTIPAPALCPKCAPIAKKERVRLEKEIKDLKGQIDKLGGGNDALEAEKNRLQSRVTELELELKLGNNEKVVELTEALQRSRNDNAGLRLEIESRDARLAQLEEEILKLKQPADTEGVGELQQVAQTLVRREEEVRQSVGFLIAKAREVGLDELAAAVDDSVNRQADTRQELAVLAGRYPGSIGIEIAATVIQQIRLDVQQKIEDLETEARSARDQLEEAEGREKALTEEVKKLKEELDVLKVNPSAPRPPVVEPEAPSEELRELQVRHRELEAKYHELEADHQKQGIKNQELEAKNQELEAKQQELEEKHRELEAKYQELEEKSTQQEQEWAEATEECARLNQRVMDLERICEPGRLREEIQRRHAAMARASDLEKELRRRDQGDPERAQMQRDLADLQQRYYQVVELERQARVEATSKANEVTELRKRLGEAGG